MVSGDTDGVFE